jgi:hemerythrin-like domain-containing protein
VTQPQRLASLRPAPAAGFEQPFEMLEACHQRVQRMLTLLARLRAHLRDHGADVQAQQAARDLMRYFDLAAPQHHRDEELHVFPRLLAQGDPGVTKVVGRLQQDHLAMESQWAAARLVLSRISTGELRQLAGTDDAALDAFSGLYGEHLAAEEEIAYPRAKALMDAADLEQAGQEMARRRGVR